MKAVRLARATRSGGGVQSGSRPASLIGPESTDCSRSYTSPTRAALRAPDARANSVTRSLRSHSCRRHHHAAYSPRCCRGDRRGRRHDPVLLGYLCARSEEHTSELQSQSNLVCRLLLEKKKKKLDTAHG